MKIAVVTPYYLEEYSILYRCYNSVLNQTEKVDHFFISDGHPHPYISHLSASKKIQHIIMNGSHNDAGATPRAIGALSAFSQEYDAVSFLDVDNTYLPNHIKISSNHFSHDIDVVTSTRNICDINGNVMYVDNVESNGTDFCDTNCLFIGKSTLNLLSYWITNKKQRLISDKLFWNAIVSSNLKKCHSDIPTVNYFSKWAWHYEYANRPIPDDAVWMATDANENMFQIKQKNVK